MFHFLKHHRRTERLLFFFTTKIYQKHYLFSIDVTSYTWFYNATAINIAKTEMEPMESSSFGYMDWEEKLIFPCPADTKVMIQKGGQSVNTEKFSTKTTKRQINHSNQQRDVSNDEVSLDSAQSSAIADDKKCDEPKEIAPSTSPSNQCTNISVTSNTPKMTSVLNTPSSAIQTKAAKKNFTVTLTPATILHSSPIPQIVHKTTQNISVGLPQSVSSCTLPSFTSAFVSHLPVFATNQNQTSAFGSGINTPAFGSTSNNVFESAAVTKYQHTFDIGSSLFSTPATTQSNNNAFSSFGVFAFGQNSTQIQANTTKPLQFSTPTATTAPTQSTVLSAGHR